MNTTVHPKPTLDLAGYCHPQPNYFHTKQRLKYLAESYLAPQVLTQRLQDLPQQFEQPRQRPWERFDWRAISAEQIVGVERDLFASLIAASAEVEAPIRDYAQISRAYLQAVHPQMSRFISGSYDDEGKRIEVGVWEKEERQHAPTFCKLYQQLVGERFTPHSNTITTLEPETDPGEDLYRHAIRRITTEWSAVSLYLWLMAHSTGALQQAIAQPLQDEVNHLAKFWGMTRWGFADQTFNRLVGMTAQFVQMFDHHQGDRTTSSEILQIGNLRYGAELTYIFTRVLRQMCDWNKHLQPEILQGLFGRQPRLQAG